MTKRLQAVSRNAAPDLPKKCKGHKQHKSTICKNICAQCARLWLGAFPLWQLQARERANENQLNSRRELPYVR